MGLTLIIVAILITIIIIIGGIEDDNQNDIYNNNIDNNSDHGQVSDLEKIAVLSVFRIHASPYEKYVLDHIIEEIEKRAGDEG